ncbi:hypothetical protein Zmor_015228 [Zophobas morio]|uniref:O-acyltransferase n=1 Tax=Zophobas morio TaxID=2755281 RepID=A0AA38IGS1_9CUCU|nr:hypothetical protein Zmor_015228 [Zophobas morio]
MIASSLKSRSILSNVVKVSRQIIFKNTQKIMSGKRGFTQYSTDVKIFTDFDDHKSKKLKIMSKVLVKVGDSNGDSVKEAGNVGSSSLEEVIDDVIERCIPPINNNKASVLEESQLNDNQDDIFNKAIEEHELRLAAEERRKEEMLHIPREKNLLLNPNTFKLSPSGDASVTVGFKMPTGEVVCRLYNLTETEYIDFNLREFVQFTKKIQNKVIKQFINSVGNNDIWISVDETTDRLGRYITHLVIGKLSSEEAGRPFLLALKQLDKTNSSKIEKKFVIRNSVLTDIFDHHQTRNLYNFLAIFFICFSIHTLGSEYFITGRITFGFGLIRKAFLHFDKAIFVWLCSFASVCAMFYVFKMWLILTTFAKGKTIIFYWFGATCLVLYYFCSLKLVTYAIRYFEFNVIGKFFLTYEQSRLLMKVHAFVRSKISNEPSGLSFSKYLYFLFAPTLIYRDTYPRTNTINWKFVVQCLLDSITIFFVLTFCAMNTFPCPERLAQKYTLSDVIFEFLDKILYTPLALTQYFLVFHTVQNLFAEMLRFGDRLFYLDWWNQHSFNAWLTEWNIT